MLHRSLDIEVRAIDVEKRRASFVASTERAVMTGMGPEVLRMRGARLQRYRKNPVVLDSHERYGIDAIVGRAEVRVDNATRQLLADVEFAPSPRGEAAWALVRDGFLRAVSVGYRPNGKRTRQLREGEADGEGEARVSGPALIVNEWELVELSMVPVPADEDALRRAFYAEGGEMQFSEIVDGGSPAAPAPAQPAAPVKDEAVVRAEAAAAAAKARAEEHAANAAQIRDLARGAGLVDLGESCVLEGLSVEESRKRLLEAHAAKRKPLGTPEPAAATVAPANTTNTKRTLTGTDLVTAFRGF